MTSLSISNDPSSGSMDEEEEEDVDAFASLERMKLMRQRHGLDSGASPEPPIDDPFAPSRDVPSAPRASGDAPSPSGDDKRAWSWTGSNNSRNSSRTTVEEDGDDLERLISLDAENEFERRAPAPAAEGNISPFASELASMNPLPHPTAAYPALPLIASKLAANPAHESSHHSLLSSSSSTSYKKSLPAETITADKELTPAIESTFKQKAKKSAPTPQIAAFFARASKQDVHSSSTASPSSSSAPVSSSSVVKAATKQKEVNFFAQRAKAQKNVDSKSSLESPVNISSSLPAVSPLPSISTSSFSASSHSSPSSFNSSHSSFSPSSSSSSSPSSAQSATSSSIASARLPSLSATKSIALTKPLFSAVESDDEQASEDEENDIERQLMSDSENEHEDEQLGIDTTAAMDNEERDEAIASRVETDEAMEEERVAAVNEEDELAMIEQLASEDEEEDNEQHRMDARLPQGLEDERGEGEEDDAEEGEEEEEEGGWHAMQDRDEQRRREFDELHQRTHRLIDSSSSSSSPSNLSASALLEKLLSSNFKDDEASKAAREEEEEDEIPEAFKLLVQRVQHRASRILLPERRLNDRNGHVRCSSVAEFERAQRRRRNEALGGTEGHEARSVAGEHEDGEEEEEEEEQVNWHGVPRRAASTDNELEADDCILEIIDDSADEAEMQPMPSARAEEQEEEEEEEQEPEEEQAEPIARTVASVAQAGDSQALTLDAMLDDDNLLVERSSPSSSSCVVSTAASSTAPLAAPSASALALDASTLPLESADESMQADSDFEDEEERAIAARALASKRRQPEIKEAHASPASSSSSLPSSSSFLPSSSMSAAAVPSSCDNSLDATLPMEEDIIDIAPSSPPSSSLSPPSLSCPSSSSSFAASSCPPIAAPCRPPSSSAFSSASTLAPDLQRSSSALNRQESKLRTGVLRASFVEGEAEEGVEEDDAEHRTKTARSKFARSSSNIVKSTAREEEEEEEEQSALNELVDDGFVTLEHVPERGGARSQARLDAARSMQEAEGDVDRMRRSASRSSSSSSPSSSPKASPNSSPKQTARAALFEEEEDRAHGAAEDEEEEDAAERQQRRETLSFRQMQRTRSTVMSAAQRHVLQSLTMASCSLVTRTTTSSSSLSRANSSTLPPASPALSLGSVGSMTRVNLLHERTAAKSRPVQRADAAITLSIKGSANLNQGVFFRRTASTTLSPSDDAVASSTAHSSSRSSSSAPADKTSQAAAVNTNGKRSASTIASGAPINSSSLSALARAFSTTANPWKAPKMPALVHQIGKES